MNGEKMGRFIAELRKSKQMTQKDLAEILNITDKAVSKWERGLSCPDISLLSALAELLGVTTGELLNGERDKAGTPDMESQVQNVLQYADTNVKSRARTLQNIGAAVFSILLLTGAVVCAICDVAVSGGFGWSLLVIGSIVFAWLVFFPVVKFGAKGVIGTIAALSLLIFPYLLLLDRLIPSNGLLLPIGIRMAGIVVGFLWAVFMVFRFWRTRRRLATAVSLLLAVPAGFLVNFSLSLLIFEPLIDVWDILGYTVLAGAAAVFFLMDSAARRKQPA